VISLVATHPLARDGWGNQRIGFTGTTTISRKDFGIDATAFWNNEFDPGRRGIGDAIEIDAAIELEAVNMGTRSAPKAEALVKRIDADGLDATVASVRSGAPADPKGSEFAAYRTIVANAALILRQAGRFREGAALCAVLTAIDPKDAETLSAQAELELLAGERKRAVGDFKRALAADPTNTVAAEYLRHL
jgi:tetratricopeptide (TPR) repeat protein